ncbi:hypothetical protein [Planktothrix agardhii]|jgi:hypothetical protein|uniref:hypothetical protein n=1 Tax=Planktothrix agardhii TaxID=1160 RepID=UPI000DBB3942|nr:hypothetical protein [Planktothrix agardhii]BBD57128.1 hypothetical protein NIES204_44640 [Planktothrix agardhii NIES-204]MCB8788900.1 hypothetical protein [Planktothrix agardhii 1025]MCF3605057.1 hypothetical protein [Planktothrix agardhii 1804]MCF3614207.1 hypothetical protein [Planktothrix agardhii 1027]MCF3647569.1 hypothetical protein [Planktothrix agardhii 1026]
MPIPPEIERLINEINLELDEIEGLATEGLAIANRFLVLFENNPIFLQVSYFFNSVLFYVDKTRRDIQNTREQLSEDISPLVASAIIYEVGEYLSTLKGEVLETKSRTLAYRNRLENLQ